MTTQTSLVEQARELLLSDTQKFYALMSAERRRIYGGDPSPMERIEVDLSGIDLSGARIAHTGGGLLGLGDICFEFANLAGVSFGRCNFKRSRFSGASIQVARFDKCRLMSADLRGVLARRAIFIECRLDDSNCEGSNLQESIAIKCCFDGAKMAGVDMQHANMKACTFESADFTGTDMRWADFRTSSIYGARGLTRRFYRRHRLAVERSIGFDPK